MFEIDDMVVVTDTNSEFYNFKGIVIDIVSDIMLESEWIIVQTENGEILWFTVNQLDKHLMDV